VLLRTYQILVKTKLNVGIDGEVDQEPNCLFLKVVIQHSQQVCFDAGRIRRLSITMNLNFENIAIRSKLGE
jgi:hypothetical protein